MVAKDLYTGCAEQLALTPELVGQLLDDHVADPDGWCQENGSRHERYPCSIRQLAELAQAQLSARSRRPATA